jgi:hypothetical protein
VERVQSAHTDKLSVVSNQNIANPSPFLWDKHIEQQSICRGADKLLAQPGRKQATATEDFDVHISYLL